jgi:predicted Rossmann fold flavoprotein
MQNNLHFDTIIIGGGAAGQMAAISHHIHNPTKSLALIDRTFALGRKILVCGAGRCNITNYNLHNEYATRYYGSTPEFILSVIEQFGYDHIVNFFEELGVKLYIERKTDIGKLFPVTNQAKTITSMLEDEMKRNDTQIFLNTEVQKISKIDNKFSLICKSTDNTHNDVIQFGCDNIILAAGGMTYPALGSNGSGYELAKSLGHKIIQPVPSALPLESKNTLSHLLQGVKQEIEVTSIIDDKEIKKRTDEVMFTKYGVSGPAILNISREISIAINRHNNNNVKVRLNFFPELDKKSILNLLQARWDKRPNQTIENSLFGLFPNKIASTIVSISSIDTNIQVKDLTQQNKDVLTETLANYEIPIIATRGWNEAEFTAGGVDTSQIKPHTLESKIINNMFFCGETLDVDGDVGGFNLSWAWSSGWVAGKLQSYI